MHIQLRILSDLYQKLQDEFNTRVLCLHKEAQAITRERAKHYDKKRPVWERVAFPDGFMHEIGKKVGRVKAGTSDDDFLAPVSWAHTREDLLDTANYIYFMVAYGDMLVEEDINEGTCHNAAEPTFHDNATQP